MLRMSQALAEAWVGFMTLHSEDLEDSKVCFFVTENVSEDLEGHFQLTVFSPEWVPCYHEGLAGSSKDRHKPRRFQVLPSSRDYL